MDRWACFLNCIHFEPQHLSQHGQEVLKVLRTKGHDNWAKCIYKQRSCDMTESSRTPTIWTLWKRLFSRSGMCFTHSASCNLQRISSTFIAVKTNSNVKKDILFPIMDYLSQVNFHISVNWFLNTIVKGMETIAASMVENILKTLKHNRKFGITCHIFHMCKNTGMVL